MTISGRPDFGLEDVPWTLAAHRFDVLRTSIDTNGPNSDRNF